MPTNAPTKRDTITISRTLANLVALMLVANVIDDLSHFTGWHILVALSASARTVALVLTVWWLFTRKAKHGSD